MNIIPENESKAFDIEAFAKDGKHVFLSGRDLLEIADKIPPENFRIDMIIHGGRPRKIGLTEKVDLAEFGVERFVTMPLDPTEG